MCSVSSRIWRVPSRETVAHTRSSLAEADIDKDATIPSVNAAPQGRDTGCNRRASVGPPRAVRLSRDEYFETAIAAPKRLLTQ